MPLDMSIRIYSSEHLLGILSEMGTVEKPNYFISSQIISETANESIILSTKAQPIFSQQRRPLRGTFRTTSTPTRATTRGTTFSANPFPSVHKYPARLTSLFPLPNDFEEHLALKSNEALFEDSTKEGSSSIVDAPVVNSQPADINKDPFDVVQPSYFYSLVHNTVNESFSSYGAPNKGSDVVDKKNNTENTTLQQSGVSTDLDYITANESHIAGDFTKTVPKEQVVEVEAITTVASSLENDLHITDVKKTEDSKGQTFEEGELIGEKDEGSTLDVLRLIDEVLDHSNKKCKATAVKPKKQVKKISEPDDGFIGFKENLKKAAKKALEVPDTHKGVSRSSARNFNNSRVKTNVPKTKINKATLPRGTSDRGASNRAAQKQRGSHVINSTSTDKNSLFNEFFTDDRFVSIEEIIKETKENEKKEVHVKPKPKPPTVVSELPPPAPILTIEEIAAEQRQQELKSDQTKKGGNFWSNVMNMF